MRGTKIINWSTPREIQQKVENTHVTTRKPAKLRKKYCKALKGEHRYAWKQGFLSVWFDEVCQGCGKKRDYLVVEAGSTLEEELKRREADKR